MIQALGVLFEVLWSHSSGVSTGGGGIVVEL